MGQQSPLVRQWIVLRTLSARGLGATVKELAEAAEVCDKTIRRDLQMLSDAGFPLEETIHEFGRKHWRMRPWSDRPELSFVMDEAIALYLGCHLLEPLAGTFFWDASRRALIKIKATLGQDALRYVDRFREFFHETLVGAADYAKKAELIDQLVQGIEDRRVVFITYQSLRSTEPVTYDIHPYGIIKHGHTLYLVGFAPQHNAIREWKIDRIEDARVDAFPFTRPADFDLKAYYAHSFGVYHGQGDHRVTIRFSATVARHVQESTWHPSQKLTPQPDGSLIAEFRLDTTEELKHWILSFGRHAEVLEPEELRGEMGEEARAMMAHYETPRQSRRHERSKGKKHDR